MSKEYLEALDWLLENEMIYRGRTQLPISPALRDIKHRLESIDNAEPSEALEEIKTLRGFNQVELNNDENVNKSLDTIEQALLKAQKPKQYLKWEDLEFKEEEQWLKVKMGNNFYRIVWCIDGLGSDVVSLYKYITNDYLVYCACIKNNSQQFFNDLHLERVEECQD